MDGVAPVIACRGTDRLNGGHARRAATRMLAGGRADDRGALRSWATRPRTRRRASRVPGSSAARDAGRHGRGRVRGRRRRRCGMRRARGAGQARRSDSASRQPSAGRPVDPVIAAVRHAVSSSRPRPTASASANRRSQKPADLRVDDDAKRVAGCAAEAVGHLHGEDKCAPCAPSPRPSSVRGGASLGVRTSSLWGSGHQMRPAP
jgi:hypothetical protein